MNISRQWFWELAGSKLGTNILGVEKSAEQQLVTLISKEMKSKKPPAMLYPNEWNSFQLINPPYLLPTSSRLTSQNLPKTSGWCPQMHRGYKHSRNLANN
ncbi:hypothetical protein Tco_0688135 [Tanacetum coccineum]